MIINYWFKGYILKFFLMRDEIDVNTVMIFGFARFLYYTYFGLITMRQIGYYV